MQSPARRLAQLLGLLLAIASHCVLANKIDSLQLYGYYNAQMHNTKKFETVKPDSTSDLIVRRGQNVYLAVKLAQPLDPKFSQLYLRVMYGPNPQQQDGTMFILPVEQSGSNNGSWSAHSYASKNNQVDFKLFVGNNAAVGGYRINFIIVENNQIVSEVTAKNNVYVLFNPWSRSDTVYMPDQSDLDEYILNTFGIIYMNSIYDQELKEWYYDQFRKSAIQTAVYLLDNSRLTMQQRADPVLVARAISQMSNSNDDNGVVFGKWEEPYSDGRRPWEWLRSGDILDQYVGSGGNPVRYGQCWVFAGITTTLARTLGIPARTITTYASAHDTDNTLTIDRFFDMNGNEIKGVNGDSVWNFHVWTEVWMSRPDLGGRYGNPAWQVIDATPQEKSEGIFRMGPASIQAAKNGDVNIQYDLPFLYSEVNADQISWVRDYQTGRWRKINVNTNIIGQLIVTKKKNPPGRIDYSPQILTPNYKFREGTQEERDSIRNAGRHMGLNYVYDPSVALRKTKGDVNFEFTSENRQTVGDDMVITYTLTNKANTPRTVDLTLALKSTYYTGKDGEELKKVKEKIKLGPKESRNFTVTVRPDEYLKKGVEFNHYKAIAFLNVEEKEIEFTDESTIVLSKPKLKVSVSNKPKVGQPVTTTVNFKNPFPDQPLTDCKLISPETEVSEKLEKKVNNIPANGVFSYNLTTTPKKDGDGVVVISLNCKELKDIRGNSPYVVAP